MNIFIIPSWYPTTDHPYTGIFNKEQAEALAEMFPDSNFAISTWGSHQEKLLLWGKDHFKNLPKILSYVFLKSNKRELKENLKEYYTPSLTWSRKFLSGNIQNIVKTTEKHLLDFVSEKGKVDVIHAHSGHPGGWIAMRLGEKYHLPYLITEHMTPFPFESFLTREGELSHFLKKPFLNSCYNIAVSPLQLNTLQVWNIPRLKYIPNLTNEDFFKPENSTSKVNNKFTFFTLCNLVPQKGIPVLLNAIKQDQNISKSAIFRIGGEGSMKQEYKKLALELKINERIEWLGRLSREEAVREFQQCDAFVLPSLHENLPLVLLEAIACGKPIISTRCGGPESIINDTNGLLVEPGDSAALSRALTYMINNEHTYKESEIRADFLKRYSRKVVCGQIMEVYQEVKEAYDQQSQS